MMNKIRRKRQRAALMLITAAGDYAVSGRHSGCALYETGKPERSCGSTDILLYQ